MTPYIDPAPTLSLLAWLIGEHVLVCIVAFMLGRLTND